MKGRIGTVAVGLAAVAALIAVPAAMAAYTTPKLEVQQAGTTTTFKLTQSSSEDPTAVVSIFIPTGTTLTTTQAPGTVLGKASALLRLRGLADAEVPVEGNVIVAPPGQVPADTQQRCLQGAAPLATWILSVSVAGVTVPVPVFLAPTSGAFTAFGPAYIRACFTSPYLTPAQGGLTGQPQVVNAAFSIQGVFSPISVGAFVAILVPWTVNTAIPNTAATIAAPAAIAPGSVTISAKTSGRGAVVTGIVTQAGQPRGGATVTVLGGSVKSKLTTRKRVKVSATGKFTAKFALGTFFRADAVATGAAAAPLCTQLQPLIGATPCVNPTVNGFSVKSKVVRKK